MSNINLLMPLYLVWFKRVLTYAVQIFNCLCYLAIWSNGFGQSKPSDEKDALLALLNTSQKYTNDAVRLQESISQAKTIYSMLPPNAQMDGMILKVNGDYYAALGEHECALEYYGLALAKLKTVPDTRWVMDAYGFSAISYGILRDGHNAIVFMDSANALIPFVNDDSLVFKSLYRSCQVIYFASKDPSIHQFGRRVLKIAEQYGKTESLRFQALANANYEMAYLNEVRSDYSQALHFVQDGLRFASFTHDSVLMAKCYTLTGAVNHWMKRYDIAIENYEMAKKIALHRKYARGAAFAQANIGEVYLDQGKHQRAMVELRKVLSIIDAPGHPNEPMTKMLRASVLNNLGRVYEAMHEYDSASMLLEIAVEDPDVKKFGGGFLMSRIKNSLARISLATGQTERGEQYALDVLVQSPNDLTQESLEANKILSQVYSQRGDFKRALHYHQEYARIMDTIFNVEKQKQITLLQQKFEVEAKEKEIQQLSYQNGLQADDAFYQKIITIVAVTSALILTGFAISYYVRYKHNQKVNALLQSQKEEIEIKNAELEKLSIVASKTNNAVIIADQDGEIEWSNNSFESLTGYSVEEWRSMNIHNIFGIRSHLTNERIIGPILDGYQGYIHETKYTHRDYSERWMAVSVTPVKAERGVKLVVLATDISRLKEAEERLKHSLQEKETLLKEVHHRVKNNLQIVHSLLNWQSEGITDANALDAMRVSKSRIKAMALIHQKLYQSDSMADIDFCDYAHQLTNFLLQMYSKERIHYVVNAKGMVLGVNTSITLGLILNELISNALKYAFLPDNANATIEIALEDHSSTHYHFLVRDNGVGLPPDFDITKSTSLGLRLVLSLCEQLEGHLQYKTCEGSVFEMAFPKTTF